MKTKYLLAAVAFSSIFSNVKADNDPVIMKINGRDISKSEFEYIYNKNTQQQMAEQKSLDEYVDLFVNFKLKVFEAEKRGLDTLKTFVDELEGYRSQLAKPYLIDKDMDEKLIKEAYDRLKENIKVSHILLRLDPNATASQEKAVYERMVEFKKKVEAGYDFNQLASEVSEDNSAKQNGGLLGYITGFMTVYPFETAAYTTPVGSVSDPVKTTFGYHLVYVMDRRADQGEFLASHIMKKVDLDADKKADNEAKKAIDEIYAKIVAGENFQELAKQNSDDYGSARQGGQLPWFGAGRMIPEFESEVFAIANNGEYTKPFRTKFGWHIAKLDDRRFLASYEEKKDEIFKRIQRDERATLGRDNFVNKLKSEYTIEEKIEGIQSLKSMFVEVKGFDSTFVEDALQKNIPLLQVEDKIFTSEDFARYVEKNPANKRTFKTDIVGERFVDFTNESILAYEETQLANKYDDFKNLMREYRDGILLFDVSNKEVWDKASNDTKGLEKFFKKNRKNYTWEAPRFKGYIIECKDSATMETAQKILVGLPNDSVFKTLTSTLNNDSIRNVRIKKGLYASGDNKIVDALNLNKEVEYKNEAYPVQFLHGKDLTEPETYEDVKGSVIADYQNYLDAEWIKKLRKKSKVVINQDVLKTVKPL